MSADTLSPRSARARKLAVGLLALGLAAVFAGSLVYRLEHPGMQKQIRSQASMPPTMGQGNGMNMDQVRQMMEQLEVRVTENPSDFDALFQLAEIELMRQNREGAMTWLDKARTQAGDEPAVLHQLSSYYFELAADEQARDTLLRLVELNPDDGYAHFNLGVLYRYRTNEEAKAAEEFRAVLGSQGPGLEELKKHAQQELESLSAEENQ